MDNETPKVLGRNDFRQMSDDLKIQKLQEIERKYNQNIANRKRLNRVIFQCFTTQFSSALLLGLIEMSAPFSISFILCLSVSSLPVVIDLSECERITLPLLGLNGVRFLISGGVVWLTASEYLETVETTSTSLEILREEINDYNNPDTPATLNPLILAIMSTLAIALLIKARISR